MNNTIKWIIKFGITVGLFVLLFKPEFFGLPPGKFFQVRLSDLLDELRGLSVGRFTVFILCAFVVKASGMFAAVLRWDLLLKGQNIRAPLGHLIGSFLVGRFFGAFLPSTVGLDVYRTYDIAYHSRLVAKSVAVIVVEKVIGFFALSLLVVITLPFGVEIMGRGLILPLVIVFLLPVGVSFALLMRPDLFGGLLKVRWPGGERVRSKIESAVNSVTAYQGQRVLLLKAVALGFWVHTATTLMYVFTSLAIGADVALYNVLFVGPLMIVATVGFPLTMGGEGVREFTFVSLLARIGVASQTAFLLSHLGFWVGEIISLAGGVIYVRRSPAYRPALELGSRNSDRGD
jgi:uncharacterized protein (TIRG00374 family)